MSKSLVILFLLLTAGCSGSRQSVAVSLHDLGPVDLINETEASYPPDIRIAAPEWLADTRLYYRQIFRAPTVLKHYTLDRWIAPPSELLKRRFSLIQGHQRLMLRIRLVDFEQQFVAADQARTLFTFNAEVFRNGAGKPFGQRTFRYQQANETANAAGAIKSFAELSNRAANDLANWLDSVAASNTDQKR